MHHPTQLSHPSPIICSPFIHSVIMGSLWLIITLVAAAYAILSPAFDLPDVVPVEDGLYYIQSVESGPQDEKYLAVSDSFHNLLEVYMYGFCSIAAAFLLGPEYSRVSELLNYLLYANALYSLAIRPSVAVLTTSEWMWRIIHAPDGSFTLKNEHGGGFLHADRRGDSLRESNSPTGSSFLAVKAGEDGEVYLKVLLNGARSRWLYPRGRKEGRIQNVIGLRFSKKWKWKLHQVQ